MSLSLPTIAVTRIHRNATASASPFGTPDGVSNTFQLVDRYGFEIKSNANVTAMHRTDWQGRQLLYATARTNSIYPSVPVAGGSQGNIICVGTAFQSSAVAAPDGSSTFVKLAEDTSTAVHRLDVNNLPTGINNFRVYVKAAERTVFYARFYNATDGIRSDTNVDLATGTVTGSGMTAVEVSTGVYLVTVTAASTVLDGLRFGFDPLSTPTVGDGVSGGYLWGQQYGPDDGGYIPTTTAPVTVTDYTYTSAGLVTLGQVPSATATLDWDGTGVSVG